MSVYDRWHKSRPALGDEPCKEHSRGRTKLYPTSEHGQGDRWQVRWRDENKKQCKRSFAKKEGRNPELHAEAFDAQIQASLDAGVYVDPRTGDCTFEEYAEQWRASRTHGETTGINVEHQFRLHVYSNPENPGRSKRGGPALGHHNLRNLARRPSISQQWIAGMKLADSTKLKVIDRVSEVFSAAVDDGLIARNPLHARSIQRPEPDKREAIPLTLDQLDALSLALRHSRGCAEDCDRCAPSRYEILPYLGAATGARQGEMFAIDTERDIDFLRRIIHVRRQVKIIRGKQVFAPLKNDKIHDVPLTDDAAVMLSEYMRNWPPELVTLPWIKANGELVTFRLLLSRGAGLPMHRKMVNDRWKAALKRVGISCDRYHMMHVTRHTFASSCLSEGISVRAVAECLGDTEATVQATYSHLMPNDTERVRNAIGRFFARAADERRNA
ncbi:MAG TPA: tyrosine-type recombinase/integrase [Streptosporangiaceae bacterium]|nr:tyrosine-type recombinase/integrase [Streptosporangiaceae bacterium]